MMNWFALICSIVWLTHAVVLSPHLPLGALIYMKGGEISRTFSFAQQQLIVYDITKITGKWIDLCEELEAALNGGGGGEEDTCAGKAKDDCNVDDNCMWTHKKGGKCVPMVPWKN